jgi:flagellar biosynthesis protein FlhA
MTTIAAVQGSQQGRDGARDVSFAIGIVFILTVLFLPLPAVMIDVGLAFSIAFAVLILMVALWIHRPLEFSAFPTVLLIATLLRLSLNIATTRLILSNGAEGYSAAGHVIAGFANFVMGGDFVIRGVRHSDHGQLPRHHQGRLAYRRGRRALYPRRHSRQADGHRRRRFRRHDR